METEENQDNPTPATPTTPDVDLSFSPNNHRLSEARRFASAKYDKIRRMTSAQVKHVRQYTQDARAQLHDQWGTTCSKARDAHKIGEDYVKQNPTSSVFIALGFGFLLGLLFGIRR